jgi:hypothetical protein
MNFKQGWAWRHYGFVSYPWYQVTTTQVCR